MRGVTAKRPKVQARGFVLWLVFLAVGVPALAETPELDVLNGITASATLLRGGTTAHPVLILHGFLQTRQFPTVRRLSVSLNELGYTVLTPTLSLGIPRRRLSQPCEALHLHGLEDDVAELAEWVDWLHRETGQRVVLVGHSAGGQVLTRYLHEHPEGPVERMILISLGYPIGRPLAPEPRLQDAIGRYTLGFCQNYPTTPVLFRSYVEWGAEQMLNVLKNARVPTSVILGTGDRRIPAAWKKNLLENGVDVVSIPGANHFFDSAHEFDLLDEVVAILEGEEP